MNVLRKGNVMKLRFVIWGAGLRGKTIAKILGSEKILAFVETDIELIGKTYLEKPIISAIEYEKYYTDYFLVISPFCCEEIKCFLNQINVSHYFVLNEECSELMGYGCQNAVKEVAGTFDTKQCLAIYGINIFGLLLYEELKKQGCNELYLIPSESDMECNTFSGFMEEEDVSTASMDNIIATADRIIIVKSKDRFFYEANRKDPKYMQMYDLSLKISAYHNPKIEKLKGIHTNSRCFIVATGASMKTSDLEKLRQNKEITISMNRVYAYFNRTEWRPNYYVFIDRGGIKNYEADIKNLELEHMFIGDGYESFWENYHKENVYKIHVTNSNSDSNTLNFSDTCEQMVYGGATVTYACLQLAAYLGFKNIYLLGVDCDYSQGQKSSYFIPGYVKEGTNPGAYDLKENLAAYNLAKKYTDEHGIKVYNATRGGKLEIFDRVDFDSLF